MYSTQLNIWLKVYLRKKNPYALFVHLVFTIDILSRSKHPPSLSQMIGGGGLRHKGKRDTNILFLFISSVPSWPFLRLKSNESNELIEISFQLRITPLEITKTIQKGYSGVAKLSYLNWICQKFRRIRYPMPQKLIKLPHMIIV